MTPTISSRVRLTAEARARQTEIGHAEGNVFDAGPGAVKVRWAGRNSESWHKVADVEVIR